jgi:GNAT superfamily N-acetyltransferase
MLRKAKTVESQTLTRISFSSKSYWGYPTEYFDIWNDELTITHKYIEENTVYVYEIKNKILGYYSIVELKEDFEASKIVMHKGFWLEHMFLLPGYIGRGIGTKMFTHIREICLLKGILKLGILADPNAKGFYEKMGCQYLDEFPSTIPNRTTPWLELRASNSAKQTIETLS